MALNKFGHGCIPRFVIHVATLVSALYIRSILSSNSVFEYASAIRFNRLRTRSFCHLYRRFLCFYLARLWLYCPHSPRKVETGTFNPGSLINTIFYVCSYIFSTPLLPFPLKFLNPIWDVSISVFSASITP